MGGDVRILCIIGLHISFHPLHTWFCYCISIVLALSLYVMTAEAGYWRHGYMSGRHHTGTRDKEVFEEGGGSCVTSGGLEVDIALTLMYIRRPQLDGDCRR